MGKKKGGKLDPPFAAADEDDVAALNDLLDADKAAVLAAKNRDGWSVLHQAAYAGSLDCVNALLAAGADVNGKCRDGDTPVHYASAQGHIDVIQTLVAKGGRRILDVRDNDGESPSDVALNAKVKRAIADLADADEEGEDDAEAADDDEEVEAGEEADTK